MTKKMVGLSTFVLACVQNIIFEGIHSTSAVEYKAYCIGDNVNGLYGNPMDSTTYYQCFRETCPGGHHFSEEMQQCQPSSECPVHPTTTTNPPTITTTNPPTITTTNPPTITTTTPPTITTTNPPTTTTSTTTTMEPTTTTPPPTTTTTIDMTTMDPSIFTCTQVGRFPDPFDCIKYHVCSLNDGEWTDKVYTCQSGTVFCQMYSQCYFTSYCPCQL